MYIEYNDNLCHSGIVLCLYNRYEGIRAGVRGNESRGTKGLEPGYEGISAAVRRD